MSVSLTKNALLSYYRLMVPYVNPSETISPFGFTVCLISHKRVNLMLLVVILLSLLHFCDNSLLGNCNQNLAFSFLSFFFFT